MHLVFSFSASDMQESRLANALLDWRTNLTQRDCSRLVHDLFLSRLQREEIDARLSPNWIVALTLTVHIGRVSSPASIREKKWSEERERDRAGTSSSIHPTNKSFQAMGDISYVLASGCNFHWDQSINDSEYVCQSMHAWHYRWCKRSSKQSAEACKDFSSQCKYACDWMARIRRRRRMIIFSKNFYRKLTTSPILNRSSDYPMSRFDLAKKEFITLVGVRVNTIMIFSLGRIRSFD